MKKAIIIMTLMMSLVYSYGQSFKAMLLNSNVYRTMIDLKATRLIQKNSNNVLNDTVLIRICALGHLDYKIINEDENGYVIIRILPPVKLVTTKDSSNYEVLYSGDEQLNDVNNAYNYYFAIKKGDFTPLSKTLLTTKIIGIPLIQPIKLRPSKYTEGWNLTGEFTVSYNFGLRRKLGGNPFNQNYISLIPYGLGVGAAKYFTVASDGTLTEKKDSYLVTYYQGGILFTIQKINFGFFMGFDAMIDKQNNWFYQGRPWFSFGLGYKFKND